MSVDETEAPSIPYEVQSSFLTYRNCGDAEADIWMALRDDVIPDVGERAFQITPRTMTLDQSTILSKNLSVFL